MTKTLSESFFGSLNSLWVKVFEFIPVFLGAFIILLLGLIISSILGKVAKKAMQMTKLDNLSEKIGLKAEIENFGIKLNFSELVGWVVKWFFIIATFIAVVDILNIPQLTVFLQKLVMYLPNVLVAIIILAVGLIVGKIFKNASKNALVRMRVAEGTASSLSTLAKWAVFTFALLAALVQLGIAANLIQILFTGFVIMLALAGGLAFGLGGRAHAEKILDWIENDLSHRK